MMMTKMMTRKKMMKKIMVGFNFMDRKTLFFIIFITIAIPVFTYAQIYETGLEDNFETYSTGDLNGQGSWLCYKSAGTTGSCTVGTTNVYMNNQSVSLSCTGTCSEHATSTANTDASTQYVQESFWVKIVCKTPTSTSNDFYPQFGIQTFSTSTANGFYGFRLQTAGTNDCVPETTLDVRAYYNGSFFSIATLATSTWNNKWYNGRVQIDNTTNQVRYNWNDTGWSSWYATGGYDATDTAYIWLKQLYAGGTVYYDYLAGSPTGEDDAQPDVIITPVVPAVGETYTNIGGNIYLTGSYSYSTSSLPDNYEYQTIDFLFQDSTSLLYYTGHYDISASSSSNYSASTSLPNGTFTLSYRATYVEVIPEILYGDTLSGRVLYVYHYYYPSTGTSTITVSNSQATPWSTETGLTGTSTGQQLSTIQRLFDTFSGIKLRVPFSYLIEFIDWFADLDVDTTTTAPSFNVDLISLTGTTTEASLVDFSQFSSVNITIGSETKTLREWLYLLTKIPILIGFILFARWWITWIFE